MPKKSLKDVLKQTRSDLKISKEPEKKEQMRKSTILIIEDDENVVKSLKFVLDDKYEVLTALSGERGIEKYKKHLEHISAVLLDIKMDGMDGIDVFKNLKKINPSVPVIFNTAYPGEYKPVELIQSLHPFSYIVKGTEPQVIYDNIDSAVDHYSLILEKDILNQQLGAMVDKLKELNHLSKKLTGILDKSKLINTILRDIRLVVSCDYIQYFEYNGVEWINHGVPQKDSLKFPSSLAAFSDVITGRIIAGEEYIMVRDTADDDSFAKAARRHMPGNRIRNLCAWPIDADNLHLIIMYNLDAVFFDETDSSYILKTVLSHLHTLLINISLIEERVNNKELLTIGKMAGTVVHDIHSPLSVIQGYSHILTDSNIEKDEKMIIDTLSGIGREIGHITYMTKGLSDFMRSGRQAFKASRIKLDKFIKSSLERFEPQINGLKIRIATDLKYSGYIELDEKKFNRVLHNILSNAKDALGEKGAIRISSTQEEDLVSLRIRDNGKGMEKKCAEHLFEPFYTSNKKHGLGLGMYISRQIVEEHRGVIEVESILGKGTTFLIRLPIKQD